MSCNLNLPKRKTEECAVLNGDLPKKKQKKEENNYPDFNVIPYRYFTRYFSDGKCNECGFKFSDRKSFNQKRHFMRIHKDICQTLFDEFQLNEAFQIEIPKESEKSSIETNFENFIITSGVPITIARNVYLQHLLSCIPFTITSEKRVKKMLFERCENEINATIMLVKKIGCYFVAVDGAVFKSGTNFIVMFLHYFDFVKNTFMAKMIDFCYFKETYTNTNLEQLVFKTLVKLGLDPENCVKIIINGVENMKKTLKIRILECSKKGSEEIDVETFDEDKTDQTVTENANSDVRDEDVDNDSENINSNVEFPTKISISMSFRLDLAMKKAMDNNLELKKLKTDMLETYQFCQKYSKNCDKLPKKWPILAETKFGTIVAIFDLMVETFDHINDFYQKLEKKQLPIDYKVQLKEIVRLLTPIWLFQQRIFSGEHVAISEAYIEIQKLEQQIYSTILPDFAENLKLELRSNFQDIFSFPDPLVIVAAALDPRTKFDVKDYPNIVQTIVDFTAKLKIEQIETEKPLETFEDVLGFLLSSNPLSASEIKPKAVILSEIERYFDIGTLMEPAAFWGFEKTFPLLRRLALSTLSCPVSTINGEQCFKHLQKYSYLRKNVLNEKLLRVLTILACNLE
uniref:HAT C-terminal dimerisation domain-containing protein n=1 Tax=Panagrolaimus sp. JU765 TaxID=591449 RepID=A0AC34RRY9_9BILA